METPAQSIEGLLLQLFNFEELRSVAVSLGARTGEYDLRDDLPHDSAARRAEHLADAVIRRGIERPLIEEFLRRRPHRKDKIRKLARILHVSLEDSAQWTGPNPTIVVGGARPPGWRSPLVVLGVVGICASLLWHLMAERPGQGYPPEGEASTPTTVLLGCKHPEIHNSLFGPLITFPFASDTRPERSEWLQFPAFLSVEAVARHIFVYPLLQAEQAQVPVFARDKFILCVRGTCAQPGETIGQFLRRDDVVRDTDGTVLPITVHTLHPPPNPSACADFCHAPQPGPSLRPSAPPRVLTPPGSGSRPPISPLLKESERPEVTIQTTERGIDDFTNAPPTYHPGEARIAKERDLEPCSGLVCDDWASGCAQTSTFPHDLTAGEFTIRLTLRLARPPVDRGAWVAPYDDETWWYAEPQLLGTVRSGGGDPSGDMFLTYTADGELRWLMADGADVGPGGVWSMAGMPETGDVADDRWHEVALVRRWVDAEDAALELWIDGSLVSFELSSSHRNIRQDGSWLWSLEGELGPVFAWTRAMSQIELERPVICSPS